jgi:CubicO group peptidase (beta-lactamase class C family)
MSPLRATTMVLALACCYGPHNPLQAQASHTASYSQDVLNRIAQVERKLTSPVLIEGAEQVFHSLAEQMEFYEVPGVSIAVINNGAIEWAKGYGVREAGSDSPVDVATLFQAASISKSVSALGALHWVQEGALELDRDINDFLVSWRLPENEFTTAQPVTLRHLLSHQAGLSGQLMGAYVEGEQVPTFLQMLEGVEPAKTEPVRVVSRPRTEFRYAGAGYLIVLQAMVDVLGRPYPDLMNEAVLGPAGMARSGYFQPLKYGSIENVATGHGGMGSVFDGHWETMANLAGGGLWATPSDLCLFAVEVQRAFRGESSIISRQLAEEMLTVQIGSYGLGFFLQGEDENLAFSHGGDNGGYHNYLFAYAKRGQGVAVMTNGGRGSYLYPEILRSVGIVYDWPALKPSVIVPVELPMKTLTRYTGRYVFGDIRYAEITIDDSHLRMEGDDGRIFVWYPDSENHFIDTVTGWQLEFIFDEDDEVIGALLHINGTAMRAEKSSNQ